MYEPDDEKKTCTDNPKPVSSSDHAPVIKAKHNKKKYIERQTETTFFFLYIYICAEIHSFILPSSAAAAATLGSIPIPITFSLASILLKPGFQILEIREKDSSTTLLHVIHIPIPKPVVRGEITEGGGLNIMQWE